MLLNQPIIDKFHLFCYYYSFGNQLPAEASHGPDSSTSRRLVWPTQGQAHFGHRPRPALALPLRWRRRFAWLLRWHKQRLLSLHLETRRMWRRNLTGFGSDRRDHLVTSASRLAASATADREEKRPATAQVARPQPRPGHSHFCVLECPGRFYLSQNIATTLTKLLKYAIFFGQPSCFTPALTPNRSLKIGESR